MPSILTHQYFADQLLLQYNKTWPFLSKHIPVVWVGSQGPDPFFFFGKAPFKKRLGQQTINAFGSTLHNQLPVKSIAPLLKQGWYSGKKDEVRQAYVFGALSHYVLDRVCHPYVFYRSGFDDQGQLTGFFSADHARLEVEIDLGLSQKLKLSSKHYQPKNTLKIDSLSLSHVSELYAKAFEKDLNLDTYRQAVEDMRSTYQFLYHGSWLNRLLVILLAGKRSLPYSLIHPIKLKETIANRAMNTARKTWYHPVTKVASRQSFIQLMDEALTLFASLIPLLQADTFDEKKWRAFTQGIDYDGKIYQTKMSHQDSYYQP
ncbi:MAG: zinc dependent phospholipase C family protein [Bacilli bacterium]